VKILVSRGLVALFFSFGLTLSLFSGGAQASSGEIMAKASSVDVSTEKLELYVVPLTNEQLSELAVVWQGHMASVMSSFVGQSEQAQKLTGSAGRSHACQSREHGERAGAYRRELQKRSVELGRKGW
jgi:hypothetical protein